ncbi:hypothetical protein PVNG_02398 [Plasmodium vivax North Korean]|uniref:site-specific DNA-methyltransferase (adenine-specific) n=1 Tax=Plasmodium vivax North Korean TaxID=1035514 RepID=A0A0J9TKK6_PLAVI|nr:hypothetical protein PVNG_02398 [Plasmodium vivax North Korean]
MIIHGMPFKSFDIQREDTLVNPRHLEENENGRAAIVCSTSVLDRKSEEIFRKHLIDKNHIDAVILLPPNLFYGTSIVTCILVLRKTSKVDHNVLFIDASKEFEAKKKQNVLSEGNIERIFDLYKQRKDEQFISAVVANTTIAENDYVLSVNRYIEKPPRPEDTVDIEQLNADIDARVEKINHLRREIKDIIAEINQKIKEHSSDKENKKILDIESFAESFLASNHIKEFIARFLVLIEEGQEPDLKAMRSYQIHAIKESLNKDYEEEGEQRIRTVSEIILRDFDKCTCREGILASIEEKRKRGYNSMFTVSSIAMAKRYYIELQKQNKEKKLGLKISIIYSSNDVKTKEEGQDSGSSNLSDLDVDLLQLDDSRFLEQQIKEYDPGISLSRLKEYFSTIQRDVRNGTIDILIVVNMLLTGFDAPRLNTL